MNNHTPKWVNEITIYYLPKYSYAYSQQDKQEMQKQRELMVVYLTEIMKYQYIHGIKKLKTEMNKRLHWEKGKVMDCKWNDSIFSMCSVLTQLEKEFSL